jgi:hypothetical protein
MGDQRPRPVSIRLRQLGPLHHGRRTQGRRRQPHRRDGRWRHLGGISRAAGRFPPLLRPGRVEVSHFTKRDGLPSDSVLFLGLDARRRLWIGTDNGVAVRSPAGWTVYNHEDGLVWDDCAAGAFFAEPDGTVWIGTLKGLSRYRPSGRAAGSLAPPVVVTALRFGERPANPTVHSEVPFRDRDFLATFAALSFLREKSIAFPLPPPRPRRPLDRDRATRGPLPQPAAGLLSLPGGRAPCQRPLESRPGRGLLPHRAAMVGHLVVSLPGVPARRAARRAGLCAPA